MYYLLYENRAGWPDVYVGSAPRLHIVNGFPDSPKMEAKGAFLVRGPQDETPGSPGLPFNINQS